MQSALRAIEHLRRMRGQSQAHLMRASDGNLYVTKFQNNPGGIRVLASEFFATKLALFLGLPMAEIRMLTVPHALILNSPDLTVKVNGVTLPCAAGLQLASRYAARPGEYEVFDYMPKSQFHRVVNRHDLVRMLVFDKWTGNCDNRQAVFVRDTEEVNYRMTFIDQHYCFDGHRWTFPDLPHMGTYEWNQAYLKVTGWDSFEPLLSQVEAIEYADLWRCAGQVPHEWYEYDGEGLFQLVEVLHERRFLVRNLISEFRHSKWNPFPHWSETCTYSAGTTKTYEALSD